MCHLTEMASHSECSYIGTSKIILKTTYSFQDTILNIYCTPRRDPELDMHNQRTRPQSTNSKKPLEADTIALMTGKLGHKAEMNTEGQHSTAPRTTHNQNSESRAHPMCSLTTTPGQVLLENEKDHTVWTCNVRWKQQ